MWREELQKKHSEQLGKVRTRIWHSQTLKGKQVEEGEQWSSERRVKGYTEVKGRGKREGHRSWQTEVKRSSPSRVI